MLVFLCSFLFIILSVLTSVSLRLRTGFWGIITGYIIGKGFISRVWQPLIHKLISLRGIKAANNGTVLTKSTCS
jgi:hypothetical protein